MRPTPRWHLRLSTALCCALALATPARAAFTIVPTGFLAEDVVTGLPFATAVAFAPDGRLFLALKSGVVRVVDANGTLLPAPFIDLSASVNDNHDRGLLGLALHPQFPAQPYVYLLFTYDPPGVTADFRAGARVARLIRVEADPAQNFAVALPGMDAPQVTSGGPGHWVVLGTNSTSANIGDPVNGRNLALASCMTSFSMAQPPIEDCIAADEDSHTIGTLAFAPDGSLFVSNGDGSMYPGVDPRALRAQLPDSLSGKILRIDPATGLGLPDNPFFNAASPNSNRSKVWALGLRNPFRIAVDPVSSDVYVGDVGWNSWEEIDRGKGANFGWPCYEGGAASGAEGGLTTSLRQPGYETASSTRTQCQALFAAGAGAVVPPAFAYNHAGLDGYGTSGGAASNAGAVYTGGTYPGSYDGSLFIADYTRRWIRTLSFDQAGVASVANFAREGANGVAQLLRGPDTNIYALVYHQTSSRLVRFRYVGGGNAQPTAVATATPSSGVIPLDVSFSAQGSFDPDAQPLSYAWDFGDGATGAGVDVVHTYVAAGAHVVTLTVSELTAPFASATTTAVVTTGVVPPIVTITAPVSGAAFALGDAIDYAGGADAGGVPVPHSALTWDLIEHHNEHVHFSRVGTGNVGTYTIGDHADGVWYELCLTADWFAVSDTQCVSVVPRTTPIAIDSDPVGAPIIYQEEGLLLPTPAQVNPTQGATRTLTAPAIHQWRTFSSWSDGVEEATRQFVVGPTPLSFTALYGNLPPAALFFATPLGGTTLAFDGSASRDPEGGALSFAWDFGDGSTATGETPENTFAAAGNYTVTLQVTDTLGATDTQQRLIAVGANQPPAAAGAASVASGPGRLSVTFDASGSSDSDGTISAYDWSFGDGASGSGLSPSHTYAAPGSYGATLTVTDDGGASASVPVSVVIPNSAPSAVFSATPASGDAPLLVAFDASASSDGDGDALSFAWDFGDAATANGVAAARSYGVPGSYIATLVATDPFGASGSAQRSIGVTVPPPPNLPPTVDAGADVSVTAPAAASLDGFASDDGLPAGMLSALWSLVSGPPGAAVQFADATAIDTTATFSSAGVYVLQLAVSDGALQSSDTVSVSNWALASFTRTAARVDDAEQLTGGAVTLNSSDLELGPSQTVGVRFTNLTIPAAAKILDASVQFEVDEASTSASSLLIRGERAANAPAFTTATNSLSSRTRTNGSAVWTAAPWPTIQVAGPDQRTPNLAPIFQELVGLPGWASGNAAALLMTGSGGKRVAESANGTRAPVLSVQYATLGGSAPPNTAPSVNAGADQSLTLGAGAALAGVVSDDGLPSPPGAITLQWSLISGPGTVSFSAPTSAATGASFSAAGSHVLRLTASDSALSASDDVTVTVLPAAGASLSRAVASNKDDAEENATGNVDLGSGDLEIVQEATLQTVGVRFANVTIPPGATITNAYIQFEVDEISTGPASLTIAGQRALSAATFALTPFDISSRPRTSESVAWVPAPWPTLHAAGVAQRTPSLAAVLQEIVDQPGWASGNAAAFVFTGTGKRVAKSKNSARPPILVVDYSP